MSSGRRRVLAWTGVGLLITVTLGLSVVWLNIERVDLAYEIKNMEGRMEEATTLLSKLEVERDNLLSPSRLTGLAESYGLAPAQSGDIRRVEPGSGRRPEHMQKQQ